MPEFVGYTSRERMKKMARKMMGKTGKNMSPKGMPPKEATERAFHEVSENEPSIVSKTRQKFGAVRARKQKIAIALSKARRGK